MDTEFWPEAIDLFDSVSHLQPAERGARLRELASTKSVGVRRVIEVMMATEDDLVGFLDRPIGKAAHGASEELPVAQPGDVVGPFRLTKRIGEGGMGTVFLAERIDADFEQRVAIKLLHPRLDHGALAAYFRRERRILARLEHPAITRLIDGGVSASGTAFLAMEFVDGIPVDQYCRSRTLPLAARLRLFLEICEGVRYAHSQLVLHHDLKPSNILISEEGRPKILDFGLADFLKDEGLGARSSALGVALTPNYASPERLFGGPQGTASDVYSLGVVLFQLLTDELPHDWGRRTPLDAMTRLSHEPPPLASQTGPGFPALRGDLDAILLKCLQLEPRSRYGTVEELTRDVQRHLDSRPVLAREGGIAYRFGKLLRRQAAWAAILVASVGFAILASLQAWEVGRQRDQAESERARSEAIVGLLLKSVENADRHDSGAVHTVEGMLDQAAEDAALDLAQDPETRIALLLKVGTANRGLGRSEKAAEQLTEALEILSGLPAPDATKIAEVSYAIGLTQVDRADYSGALDSFQKVLDLRRQALGEVHPLVAESWFACGVVQDLVGDPEAALASLERSLGLRKELFGDVHSATAESLDRIGAWYQKQGDYPAAHWRLHRALEIRRETLGPDHPDVAVSVNNVAVHALLTAQFRTAVEHFHEVLAIRKKALGERHPFVAHAYNGLGASLHKWGRLEEAEATLRRCLELRTELLGDDHDHVAVSRNNLATVLIDRGVFDAAEPLLQRSHADFERLLGESFELAIARHNFGLIHLQAGDLDRSEEDYTAALKMFEATVGADHPMVAETRHNLAWVDFVRGDFEAAEEGLKQALEHRSNALPAGHPEIAKSRLNLASVWIELERPDAARDAASQALEDLEATLVPEDWKIWEARSVLGASLVQSEPERAGQLLSDSFENLRERRTVEAFETQWALHHLLRFLKTKGDENAIEELSRWHAPAFGATWELPT